MPYGPHPSEGIPKPARKPRDKRVRITVDLTPSDYQVLNRWLARAAVELDQPLSSMTLARGMRAMIHAAAVNDAVEAAVFDLLRREQT